MRSAAVVIEARTVNMKKCQVGVNPNCCAPVSLHGWMRGVRDLNNV